MSAQNKRCTWFNEPMTTDTASTDEPTPPWSIGDKVVITGSAGQRGRHGTIADDFGELPDVSTDLGDGQPIRPKRFAILLDDGWLAFADTADLTTPS